MVICVGLVKMFHQPFELDSLRGRIDAMNRPTVGISHSRHMITTMTSMTHRPLPDPTERELSTCAAAFFFLTGSVTVLTRWPPES